MAFNKNKVMDAARKYVEKGQTDKAIKEYLKVVNHDPKDVRVWLKIGDLYAKKGAKQDATDTYMKVAKFYGEQGFYLKAVAVYKQILKLDPRMVEVNLKLAELYRQLGLLSDAMQHFERVAAFFHREGKTKEALATIRQLVDLDPDNVATRIKLAELYSKEEMTEEAIKEFRHACDYLRSHNRQDDFIKVAERLLWHDNSDIGLNRELATLYLRRNDPRRALQKLQTCFKADSRDVETLALLAQAFQALDQKSKTVSVLKELARVFTENGQTAQAADVHRKILMFSPDDPDSREALGEPPSNRAPPVVSPAPIVPDNPYTPPPNPTGSVPIVQATGAEPVVAYEDDDFAAEISVDDESFHIGSDQVEANADEIVKILTETDVYVKYGLQQKAIDHLQRVFELDPGNVEARERLKDIYIGADRAGDAVEELLALAERVGPQDASRAELYLTEAAGLDPNDNRANRMAAQLGVQLSMPDVEIIDEGSEGIELSADDFGTGSVAAIDDDDLEFDDIDFADMDDGAVDAPTYLPSEELSAEFEVSGGDYDLGIADFEDGGGGDGFDFELDDFGLDDGGGPRADVDGTQEVVIEQVAEELSLDDSDVQELSFDDVVEGTTELAVDDIELLDDSDVGEPVEELSFESPVGFDGHRADSADSQYDDFSLSNYEAEPAGAFDDAESLDAAPIDGDMDFPSELPRSPSAPEIYGADAAAYTPAPYGDAPEHLPPDDTEYVSQAFPDAHEYIDAPEHLPPEDLELSGTTDVGAEPAEVASDDAAGTSLEDDLDEADFFVTQNLFDEARDILSGLLDHYPEHPLILAKLQDIAALEGGGADVAPELTSEPVPVERIDHELATRESTAETAASAKPTIKLEQSVDDEDADTHFDLGLAYKEMGLYDEAIKAFTKVSGVSARAVECHLMVGLCYREQGALAEAVQQFKAGLYVDGISDREKLGLYYEIGVAYETMDDADEALYFLEIVMKKDGKYRDIAERVSRLRAIAGTNGSPKKKASRGADDVDNAFDAVIEGSDISRR